jgi:phosphatidylglycerophosphatase A
MWVTLLFFPGLSPVWALAGFFLFRLMDVIKPFPANRSQNLPGGWGVMMDDLLAGIYAHGLLRLLVFLINR